MEQRRQEASSRETQLKRDLERTRGELEGAAREASALGAMSAAVVASARVAALVPVVASARMVAVGARS